MRRRDFLLTPLLPAALEGQPSLVFGPRGEQFFLRGKPLQILSGEMHYARVPRPYWRHRLKLLRALGLNTLSTYCFWNLHEPRPGQFDFSDNLDVAAFIRMAADERLHVILRPGPYACAEWDFGGYPAWLLASEGMRVRTADPAFLDAARRYLKQLGRHLGGLQVTAGGPILMVQVENEYGSFGKDHAYMAAIRDAIRAAGFNVMLYTADGSSDAMLDGGTLPDLHAAVNFGATDNPGEEFHNLNRHRTGTARMCGEYWCGWFDHWGEKHAAVPPARVAEGYAWMLTRGISVNLYMAHGGTSWGFMSGANFAKVYQPDISSYDYDAPIDEAGRVTPKFTALQEAIRKNVPEAQFGPLPEPLPVVEIPRFALPESASLWQLLGAPLKADAPRRMEALNQSYGFVLYRTAVEKAVQGKLEIEEVRDYLLAFQQGRRLGVLDRRQDEHALDVQLAAGAPFDLLVENMGRINFGPRLVNDWKGIGGRVTLGGAALSGWEHYSLPLDNLSKLKFTRTPAPGPAFYRGEFALARAGDTFLDLRGWGKGNVWVNGRNLGRYWRVGPQQSLFAPGCWLKAGRNTVIVLDLEDGGERTLSGRRDAIWETSGA